MACPMLQGTVLGEFLPCFRQSDQRGSSRGAVLCLTRCLDLQQARTGLGPARTACPALRPCFLGGLFLVRAEVESHWGDVPRAHLHLSREAGPQEAGPLRLPHFS